MNEALLVLGAGGFFGRHLVRRLAARGEHVIAVSRRPVECEAANVESIAADVREAADLQPLLARCRAVVHLASSSTPGSSAGRPMVEVAENLAFTASLLHALQSSPGTRLVYVSSGGTLYAADRDAATERSTVVPRSYHGAGKAAAEHFIGAWSRQFAGSAVLLRPSNIYGPGQTERAGFGIVPTCFGKILRDETLLVWGDGSAVRDYLYIDDLIGLLLAVLDAPATPDVRVVNASSGVGISLNALFEAIEAVTGRPLRRTHETSRAVDATRVVIDPSLALREFGWAPSVTLPEGLARTWAWWQRSV